MRRINFRRVKHESSHLLAPPQNIFQPPGFCLVVLTSLRIANYSVQSLIDEFTVVASVLLMATSILSFLTIRSDKEGRAIRLENAADNIFLLALGVIFLAILLIAATVF
jgi:hypothetical protein